jgi:hypothetical protein
MGFPTHPHHETSPRQYIEEGIVGCLSFHGAGISKTQSTKHHGDPDCILFSSDCKSNSTISNLRHLSWYGAVEGSVKSKVLVAETCPFHGSRCTSLPLKSSGWRYAATHPHGKIVIGGRHSLLNEALRM